MVMGVITFRHLRLEDLPFLLEVRNHVSTRMFLENTTEFKLDQCTEWFKTLEMPWYIIEADQPVGYVRRFHYEDGISVGVDIHPDYRRKGYATAAFKKVIAEEPLTLYLWVFADNFAYHLYTKLGFVPIGSKQVRGKEYIKMRYR